jgi:hypothetical protein
VPQPSRRGAWPPYGSIRWRSRTHAGAEELTAAEVATAVRFLTAMKQQIRAAAEEAAE